VAAPAPPVHLDPRCRLFLAALSASGWPPMHQRTPRQARADLRILAAAANSTPWVAHVADTLIGTADVRIPVRIYRHGSGTERRPLVVWLHGGGFVVGDLFTADGTCRQLARSSGATVISVHYRRAPEHPLPAAQTDALAAAQWAVRHASELGADPARLVVAGDSAGGALAAHVAQRLRDAGPWPAALQVLVYPATDFSLSRADRDPRLAKLLDWDTIEWFAEHALPRGVNRRDPVISPRFAADLSGLPPAVIVTAGVDPFTADAIGYGTALSSAGVPVTHLAYPGQIHSFVGMDRFFPAAGDAIRRIGALIRGAEPAASPSAPGTGPAPQPAEPISWADAAAARCRRSGEQIRRLPHVNGTYMLLTLLEHRLRSTASQVTDHGRSLSSTLSALVRSLS
jgi:acetyl esterase/lipase